MFLSDVTGYSCPSTTCSYVYRRITDEEVYHDDTIVREIYVTSFSGITNPSGQVCTTVAFNHMIKNRHYDIRAADTNALADLISFDAHLSKLLHAVNDSVWMIQTM